MNAKNNLEPSKYEGCGLLDLWSTLLPAASPRSLLEGINAMESRDYLTLRSKGVEVDPLLDVEVDPLYEVEVSTTFPSERTLKTGSEIGIKSHIPFC